MKKTIRGFCTGLSVAAVFSMISLAACGQSVTYNGTVIPGTLGGTVDTSLPMFNSAMGTLTGVQVTLDFSVTPYGDVLNVSGSPQTFDTNSYTSGSMSHAIGDMSVTLGTDSWTVTAPTVATGNLFGTGQTVANFATLTLVGSTSAPADLTSATGLDFAAYTGPGDLNFGVNGQVSFVGGGPWYSRGGFGGAGADLTGTASVTYDFTPVPEPATLALTGLGSLALLLFRRRK